MFPSKTVSLVNNKCLVFLGATNDADNKESGNPMPDLVPRPNPEPLPSEASAYLYSECRQVSSIKKNLAKNKSTKPFLRVWTNQYVFCKS